MSSNEMPTRLEGRFEGKGSVLVRCGGRGAEMVGSEVHIKNKAGRWRTVRLTKLIQDYGLGDVCTFAFAWK